MFDAKQITDIQIKTIEHMIPKSIKGYKAAIDTYNSMILDGLSDIDLVNEAKERAFLAGQALRLIENQEKWAGEL